ncbi:MAG: hypothetical protein WBM83_04135 [Flavobacteriaceae bacterium]
MSDISIFDDNTLFVLFLLLFAPLAMLLIIAWFFKENNKPKTAKVIFFIALGYVILILALILILSISS